MRIDTMLDELCALFSATLPAEIASRFSELLRLKPIRWSKIDPWRAWENSGCSTVTEWRGTAQELLTKSEFVTHAQSEVVVLRCGHEQPSIQMQKLQDALMGTSAVFEGFISVVPGRLGLAINHDGGWCVLSNDT